MDEWAPWATQTDKLEVLLLENFAANVRPVPKRPLHSRTSTIIIRKQVLPFYYAIYNHDLQRFVELQYRLGEDGTLRHLAVAQDRQPPAHHET